MTTPSSACSVPPCEQLPDSAAVRDIAMQWLRGAVAVILTVALLGHVLGWTVNKGPFLFDEPLLYWLQAHRTEHLNHGVLHLSALGTRTVLTPVTILFVVALWLADRRRSAVLLAVTAAGAGLMDWGVKWYVGRPRPFQWGAGLMIEPVDLAVQDVSFPSGHAMATMAIFLTMGIILGRMAPNRACRLFFIGAGVAMSLAVGACRPYLGVHYPTDVLTGWAAGAAWALIGAWIWLEAPNAAGMVGVPPSGGASSATSAPAMPAPAAPPGSPPPPSWGRVGEGGPVSPPPASRGTAGEGGPGSPPPPSRGRDGEGGPGSPPPPARGRDGEGGPSSPPPPSRGRDGEGGPAAAAAAPASLPPPVAAAAAPAAAPAPAPAPVAAHTDTAEAWFAPNDDCVRRVVDLFAKARHSADVCVFTITDDRISDALLTAHRRGVAIRVISDDDKSGDLGSDIGKFRAAGIPVRLDHSPAHMHHKFAVFDGKLVMTGSFNWTRSAATQNQENFVICSDPRLIEAFTREFGRLWKQFG